MDEGKKKAKGESVHFQDHRMRRREVDIFPQSLSVRGAALGDSIGSSNHCGAVCVLNACKFILPDWDESVYVILELR